MVDAAAEAVSATYPDLEGAGLRPVREHGAFIIVFTLSAMLTALALTFIYSEHYRAENLIYFRTNIVPSLVPNNTEAFGSPVPSVTYKIIYQTISGLVHSDDVLRGIVKDLHLDYQQPRDYSGPTYVRYGKEVLYGLADVMRDVTGYASFGRVIEPDPVTAAVNKLSKQIKVVNDDSYLYTLQVTAQTPQLAVTIADHLGVALLDILRRNEESTAGKEYEKAVALEDAKMREIKDVETKLQEILTNANVVSIKQEVDQITQHASKLAQDEATTLADLRESEAKIAALTQTLAIRASPEAGRSGDLPATRRPSHLAEVDYTKLTSDKLTAEVNNRALRGRLASIQRSHAALLARYQLLNETGTEYDRLSVELKSATKDYATLTDTVQQLSIKRANGPTELFIQSKALLPKVPLSPIKFLHVLAAGVLAAIIAIGLAYVLDYFHIRFFLPPRGGPRSRGREMPLTPAPETVAPQAAGE